jgi:pyrroloquinoline quinone biosynthesis protein D
MFSGPCLTPFTTLMPTQISDDARPRLARGVRLQIDSATGKSVLLFPEGIVELNETAQDILGRCDGRALSEIALGLAEDYEVDLATLVVDVREILADLQRRKLVDIS